MLENLPCLPWKIPSEKISQWKVPRHKMLLPGKLPLDNSILTPNSPQKFFCLLLQLKISPLHTPT